MALRPGSCLLMSSHFMPSPLKWMILASSSPDHFDCFLAGDSADKVDVRSIARLAGITLEFDVVVCDFEDNDGAAMLDLAESERGGDLCRGSEPLSASRGDTSSSLDFRRNEISTVDGWLQDWPQG